MWCVSPVVNSNVPSGLVPITALDSFVQPHPTMGSGQQPGMRCSSRPEGMPRMRASPVWPPLQTP